MNAADQLAEFYEVTPRRSSDLSGRSGEYGAVDAALNELEVPAALDDDGDWTLETDVGSLALILDDVTGDLVVIQALRDRESIGSPDFMHALLRLNFEVRGLGRCGAITQSGKDVFVISARVAGSEASTETVGRLLADCMRLSRRIDELLEEARGVGAEPEPPAAEPPPTDEPVAAPSAPTVFSQPIPTGPPPAETEAEPTAGGAEPGPPEPSPPEPRPPESTPPEPATWGPPAAEPSPAEPAVWDPPPAEPAPAAPAPAEPAPWEPPSADPPPQYAPPQPDLPPANWYPDPHGLARLRYWDGQQWTEHVAQ